jgi:hypothetical protein
MVVPERDYAPVNLELSQIGKEEAVGAATLY